MGCGEEEKIRLIALLFHFNLCDSYFMEMWCIISCLLGFYEIYRIDYVG